MTDDLSPVVGAAAREDCTRRTTALARIARETNSGWLRNVWSRGEWQIVALVPDDQEALDSVGSTADQGRQRLVGDLAGTNVEQRLADVRAVL
ncbi:hypothetical protein CU254_41120 (plasmid) [Amycolatopsis sp. AA4]|uniref:hypothetical protein n=1 Tax=Actinomycetes TaxID=1760 RepID=UPI0001B56169|nr:MULTISPECIES: hypothetical protein [Actinomycetes]ATY16995.1 hypothetical protein CU254_41120 [Amycolatopsis sp. AA4]